MFPSTVPANLDGEQHRKLLDFLSNIYIYFVVVVVVGSSEREKEEFCLHTLTHISWKATTANVVVPFFYSYANNNNNCFVYTDKKTVNCSS